MKIPIMNLKAGYPQFIKEVEEKIKILLKNTSFIGGEEVHLFEEEFSKFNGTKYCIGCSNGTHAIEIILRALEIGVNDKVVVPANTFISTAEAVSMVNAEVVFCDIDEEYYTISPIELEKLLKNDSAIKAVIVVHLYGQMADMDSINSIAKKYGVKVIEDAAQAQGASIKGKGPGTWGIAAAYSFYPGKNLGAFGDAGGITTNDYGLYEKCKLLVNHGRASGEKYIHSIIGSNYRLDTIQASVLRIKLKYLDEWNKKRSEVAKYYLSNIEDKKILPNQRMLNGHVWYVFTIKTKNRDGIKKILEENGIQTGIYYPIPLPFQPAFSFLNYEEGDFPITEKVAKKILSLPMYPELTNDELKYIVENLNKVGKLNV